MCAHKEGGSGASYKSLLQPPLYVTIAKGDMTRPPNFESPTFKVVVDFRLYLKIHSPLYVGWQSRRTDPPEELSVALLSFFSKAKEGLGA